MGIAHCAEGRGIIAFESGELGGAADFLTEAVNIFASYGNIGCTAHALEAAAVVIGTAGHGDAGVPLELLTAADELRRQSGQGHRPWRYAPGSEIWRTALPYPTPASAPAPAGRDYSLSAAASLAIRALRSLTTSTAS
jgi:hypothetical protein